VAKDLAQTAQRADVPLSGMTISGSVGDAGGQQQIPKFSSPPPMPAPARAGVFRAQRPPPVFSYSKIDEKIERKFVRRVSELENRVAFKKEESFLKWKSNRFQSVRTGAAFKLVGPAGLESAIRRF